MNLILIFVFALVESQIHEEPLCVRLGNVYGSMCPDQVPRSALTSQPGPPGKRGAVGEKGQMGQKGSRGVKGDAVEPNYETVEDLVAERIQEVLDAQRTKFAEFSSLLADANDKIRQLQNKSGYCQVKYDGKCFWIEFRGAGDVTFEKGKEICAAKGGKAADIYSSDHFYSILGYLTLYIRRHGYADVWTGMTYNSQSREVSLSDGTEAPFLRWHRGHPSGCCNIVLRSQATWNDRSQYFYVSSSSWNRMGVICEK